MLAAGGLLPMNGAEIRNLQLQAVSLAGISGSRSCRSQAGTAEVQQSEQTSISYYFDIIKRVSQASLEDF